jgi:predicted nucleic acid-binding protein
VTEEPRRTIADATVLIALGRIDRLDLLTMLAPPILVTQTVWSEVAGNPGRPGAAAIERARSVGILKVVESGDAGAYPGLDAGESATISAAAALGASVIVDERKARKLILADPHLSTAIPATLTTVALLVRAKREGLISEVRPALDQLRQEGFRLLQSVYEDVLRSAGE